MGKWDWIYRSSFTDGDGYSASSDDLDKELIEFAHSEYERNNREKIFSLSSK